MIWYLVKVPSLHYASVAFLQERLGSALKLNSTSLLCSNTVLARKRVKPLLRRSIEGESKLSSKFSFPWLWNSMWLQQRSIISWWIYVQTRTNTPQRRQTLKCHRQRRAWDISQLLLSLQRLCDPTLDLFQVKATHTARKRLYEPLVKWPIITYVIMWLEGQKILKRNLQVCLLLLII